MNFPENLLITACFYEIQIGVFIYILVEIIMIQPLPKNFFCNWRLVIHWSVFHFEINNINGNTDMKTQNHSFSVEYQNE